MNSAVQGGPLWVLRPARFHDFIGDIVFMCQMTFVLEGESLFICLTSVPSWS